MGHDYRTRFRVAPIRSGKDFRGRCWRSFWSVAAICSAAWRFSDRFRNETGETPRGLGDASIPVGAAPFIPAAAFARRDRFHIARQPEPPVKLLGANAHPHDKHASCMTEYFVARSIQQPDSRSRCPGASSGVCS
jgi:hypothetical protein